MGLPRYYWLFTFLPLLLLTLNVKAQTVLGPFDAYVSRQNPAQTHVLSGEFPFKAAKGQQAKSPASSIQGPIAISASGNEPVAEPNQRKGKKEKPANGKSTIRVTQIPAPGTTVPAQFLIKSENFLSWLLAKSDKTSSRGLVVKFNIHSLLLKMSPHVISLSKDASVIVSIVRRYPSDGSISYLSLNDNVRLTTLSNGVRVTGLGSGDDLIVATLIAGGAVYRDTIRVKAPALQTAGTLPVSNKEEEVKNPKEKSREELVQMNQANRQEIVRLKYKIHQGERILFAGTLLILAALITIGIRRYIKRGRRHNRTMDEISHIQSHKVRAPVARILGLTQLFNSSDLTDPGNKEVITRITLAAAELDGIVKEVIKKSDAHLTHALSEKKS